MNPLLLVFGDVSFLFSCVSEKNVPLQSNFFHDFPLSMKGFSIEFIFFFNFLLFGDQYYHLWLSFSIFSTNQGLGVGLQYSTEVKNIQLSPESLALCHLLVRIFSLSRFKCFSLWPIYSCFFSCLGTKDYSLE